MSTTPRIAVVDYGAGNLRSVAKALSRSGLALVDWALGSTPDVFAQASVNFMLGAYALGHNGTPNRVIGR